MIWRFQVAGEDFVLLVLIRVHLTLFKPDCCLYCWQLIRRQPFPSCESWKEGLASTLCWLHVMQIVLTWRGCLCDDLEIFLLVVLVDFVPSLFWRGLGHRGTRLLTCKKSLRRLRGVEVLIAKVSWQAERLTGLPFVAIRRTRRWGR